MYLSNVNTNKGFTLIELLVVMAIMMTVLGMVGGVVIDAADKAKQRAELLTLQETIEHTAQQSLRQNQKHYIVAEENYLWISKDDIVSNLRQFADSGELMTPTLRHDLEAKAKKITLQSLVFEGVQFVVVSRNGFSLSDPLVVNYGSSLREIPLPRLDYENKSDKWQ